MDKTKQAELEALRRACRLAMNTFRGYALMHRQKGTPEGTRKAAENDRLAAEMAKALGEAE